MLSVNIRFLSIQVFLCSRRCSMDPVEDESAPLVGRSREDSVRSGSITTPRIQLHLYFLPSTKSAITIDLQFCPITAENICVQAAKKCGNMKPPVIQSVAVFPHTSLIISSFHFPFCSFFFCAEAKVQGEIPTLEIKVCPSLHHILSQPTGF